MDRQYRDLEWIESHLIGFVRAFDDRRSLRASWQWWTKCHWLKYQNLLLSSKLIQLVERRNVHINREDLNPVVLLCCNFSLFACNFSQNVRNYCKVPSKWPKMQQSSLVLFYAALLINSIRKCDQNILMQSWTNVVVRWKSCSKFAFHFSFTLLQNDGI